MTRIIRVNGHKGDIYYVQIFDNETFEDVANLLSKKYHRTFSDIRYQEKQYSNAQKISDISEFNNPDTIISLSASISQDVQTQSKQSQNNLNNDKSSSVWKDKDHDKNIENLLDKFQIQIGLTVPKNKIVDVLRNDFPAALGTDSDNKERIKAIEYLIQTENSNYATANINDYNKDDKKVLKKIMKDTDLSLCVVAYVYFGSYRDKKETTKRLKKFLSKQ